MESCKEYRRRARQALDGNIFGTSWLYALFSCLIISMINGAISSTGVLAPVTFIVYGALQFGLCSYFLECSRRGEKKNDISVIFAGFTDNFAKNMIAGILFQLYIFLWSLLFFIPGIIMSYAYSMTFYIMKDHPEYSASQALKASRQMMKGYKMKAFLLDLSFFGWMILAVLCCGVGVLWVTPYMTAAKTELYESIKPSNSCSNAEVDYAEAFNG